MKIVHIITSLTEGGGQSLLYNFVNNKIPNKHIVICLLKNGMYIDLLRKKGIKVYALDFQNIKCILKSISNLRKIIKNENPEIIHSWLYHANLITILPFLMRTDLKIIWSVHNSSISLKTISLNTLIVAIFNSIISYFVPNKIICASKDAIDCHLKIKFNMRKMFLIPNGIDTEIYKPKKYNRNIKSDLGIKNKIVFAMIARYDKAKDHNNLVEALRLLKRKNTDWNLLLIGEGMENNNPHLNKLLNKAGIQDLTFCLGIRRDIEYILNGIDFNILSSFSEDQPIVLMEAMSCEKLCIGTDVGSTKIIIDKFGWLVPKSNPYELYKSILEAQNKDQDFINRLSKGARKHIKENFSIKNMIKNYNYLYSQVHHN
tara:strand:- start:575 stop:1693 length:1119 start_codon:yes stop_codon:yes gene_type:complete